MTLKLKNIQDKKKQHEGKTNKYKEKKNQHEAKP